MFDLEDSNIRNTNLSTIIVSKPMLFHLHKRLGEGSEGIVFKYNKDIVFKIFFNEKTTKYKKIELLGQIEESNFNFPLGLVGFRDKSKAGIYLKLIETKCKYKNFDDLYKLKDNRKIIEYLLKAEEAIMRIHKKNIIIGDIKGNNILIDSEDNPVFIDTDNYAIGEYEFDIIPDVTMYYNNVYINEITPKNNDKYIFAIMALQYFVKYTKLCNQCSPEFFKKFIKGLRVSESSKELLKNIFSDSEDKPYISEMLKDIDPDESFEYEKKIYTFR